MAAVLFAPLGLDTALLSGGTTRKKDDMAYLHLLKKDGIGNYTPLAPVLFMNIDQLSAVDFLKSPLLIKVTNSSVSRFKKYTTDLHFILLDHPHPRLWEVVSFRSEARVSKSKGGAHGHLERH